MLTSPDGLKKGDTSPLRKNEVQVTVTFTKAQLAFIEREAAEQAMTPLALIALYVRRGQMAALWGEPLHVDVAV
jgi:hypothetical protein